MARDIIRIPFSEFSDHIAEFFARVAQDHEPVVVESEEGDLVVLKPVRSSGTRFRSRRRTSEDHEAFLASFGSWNDVDDEALVRNIYESRSISARPSIEL